MKDIVQLIGIIIGCIIGFKILGIIGRNVIVMGSCQNLIFYTMLVILIPGALVGGIFKTAYMNLFNITEVEEKRGDINNRLDYVKEENKDIGSIDRNKNKSEKLILSEAMTSSELAGTNEVSYEGYKAIDGDKNTAWVEGSKGNGIGEYININLNGSYKIDELRIINGYSKNEDIYYKNNRIKKLRVSFSNDELIVNAKDGVLGEQNIVFKDREIISDYIYIEILEVYEGNKYSDTCISEIQAFGTSKN